MMQAILYFLGTPSEGGEVRNGGRGRREGREREKGKIYMFKGRWTVRAEEQYQFYFLV